jgi:hypothetical protein
MIILVENKKRLNEAVVKYPNPPEQLIKTATFVIKKISGPKLSRFDRAGLAEAIQLICGIATVLPTDKKLSYDDLYNSWRANKFNAAWSNPDIYGNSEARELAFEITRYAGSLNRLGF